ncbi:hypothetical protein AHAS_Ahas09G0183600 [Arachis hypogaea]
MMGGGDISQRSSSKNNSSRRNYNNRRIRTKGKNIVLCNYELRTMIKYLVTLENPGRPFHRCPNYESGVHCNFFCWDDGYEEYVVQVAQEIFNELNWRMKSLESSISTLKMLMLLLLCVVITIGFGFGVWLFWLS